ncbi:hypothetical protein fugu_013748 [Takifugu bimaculatus]|uniref:Nudix hydrolase domain-containing protein n=1 Tax=Takifugu bimaculatus TaxID=433685 RepID=A0A4Z2C492_9TELE|nr:hypothetical protein fugu_013748 [Takifugu bimaculatus]
MMDPDVSVLLHCAVWRGLLESQVQVELSERFNRQTDTLLESEILAVWTERVSKEPWLFNGSKFRLHSFCLVSPHSASLSSCCNQLPHVPILEAQDEQNSEPDSWTKGEENFSAGDSLHNSPLWSLNETNKYQNQRKRSEKPVDEESEPLLTLRLGLTCYKDYLGTNWSNRVSELCQMGETEFGDPWTFLAQPLGVGAILCTRDQQVVLIRRSHKVAEAGGLLDIPGGHPEPKVVCEQLGRAVCEEQIMLDMMEQKAVVSELFSSVCVEIRDEVNIPLGCLRQPVLMGVALNHTSAGRPSAEFYVSCSLTSEEVRKLYWKGGAEASESTDIIFLSQQEVLELDRHSPLWTELCPSAKGAMLLYQTVKPDGETVIKPQRRTDKQHQQVHEGVQIP